MTGEEGSMRDKLLKEDPNAGTNIMKSNAWLVVLVGVSLVTLLMIDELLFGVALGSLIAIIFLYVMGY